MSLSRPRWSAAGGADRRRRQEAPDKPATSVPAWVGSNRARCGGYRTERIQSLKSLTGACAAFSGSQTR